MFPTCWASDLRREQSHLGIETAHRFAHQREKRERIAAARADVHVGLKMNCARIVSQASGCGVSLMLRYFAFRTTPLIT